MFLNFCLKIVSWTGESLPSVAIMESLLTVTILSTLMTDLTRNPFFEPGAIRISFLLRCSGTIELMADTIKSLYLSDVIPITFLLQQFEWWSL